MKPAIKSFAVVEYTSKTGDIWKHTDEKPNYLADPIKEIDPTSFGSYVSAFKGEHIPITKLIKPNFFKKVVKRLSGSWPKNYNISYVEKFDTLLVVHQISDAHEITNFVRRVKKAYPDTFVLGVPTWPYGQLRPHIEENQKAKKDFVEYMNACDLFISVVESTTGWYKSLTDTPVIYVPQIYPANFAKQHAKPQEEKDASIFVAGVTSRPNIKQGQQVAVALQKKFPDHTIYITDITGIDYDTSELENSNYKVLPFQQWREHLPTLASHKLVINTDYTKTRGRVQVDCAAVGTPSLGGNSDGEVDLFPDLISTPETSTEELIEKGLKLLTNTEYYATVVDQAEARLHKYDFEESVARLQILVKQHRHA